MEEMEGKKLKGLANIVKGLEADVLLVLKVGGTLEIFCGSMQNILICKDWRLFKLTFDCKMIRISINCLADSETYLVEEV